MKTVCETNKCNGCMACISVCPKQCITLMDTLDAVNAVISETECAHCNLCEKFCPRKNKVEKVKPIEWKQGWALPEIRNNSTSGGAASAIIRAFIQTGGYVAACLFKEGKFLFEITNDMEVAKHFAGSKYVKSNPERIYEKIKEKLSTNKVLFVGLPCQVAGVKNYIKKKDNLYTIDILCHGTPSFKVLLRYLEEKKISIEEATDIKFRLDATTKPLERTMDCYSIAFINSISCTENCYSCDYTTIERVSDISLGDAWGTEYTNEEKKGVSLILMQTQKGRELLKQSCLEIKEVDLNRAIQYNQPLREHIPIPTGRDIFFSTIKAGHGLNHALKKADIKIYTKQKLKRVLIFLGLVKKKDKYRITIVK